MGLGYPLRAVSLLRQNPQWLSYIIIPIIINLILGGLLYWQLWHISHDSIEILRLYGQRWRDHIGGKIPQLMPYLLPWFKGLFALLIWLWRFFLLFLTGFVLSQVGSLLGSPWYGQLSEKLEIQKLGTLSSQEVGIIKEIQRAIAFELKKLVLLTGAGVMGLGLNLLPGLGAIVATLLGVSTTVTLTCLDFLDPPLERRRLGFRQKLGIIAKSLPQSAGFGLASLLWGSIPLVNLITIPLCVVAGTLFFCEEIHPRFLPPQTSSSV